MHICLSRVKMQLTVSSDCGYYVQILLSPVDDGGSCWAGGYKIVKQDCLSDFCRLLNSRHCLFD